MVSPLIAFDSGWLVRWFVGWVDIIYTKALFYSRRINLIPFPFNSFDTFSLFRMQNRT